MTTLALAVIAQLASTPACSVPGMVPQFWPAVVKPESHGDPWALHDDTVNKPYGRSYYPSTPDEAVRIATNLMDQGHSVGVGLSQLTAASVDAFKRKFHMTIREAIEQPCSNMRAGAYLYVDGKLRVYNCGSTECGADYARRIMNDVTVNASSTPLAATVVADSGEEITLNDEPAATDGEIYFNAIPNKGNQ